MQNPDPTARYFFVDESGDSTFFDRRGNCIVGNNGCSKYLMLGYVRTEHPKEIRQALVSLRDQLAKDVYFQGIPTFERTLQGFHAKDDSPEVRREVFRLLPTLPVKGQFIFARKRLSTFRNSFNSKEPAFYDHLVKHLFTRSLHLAEENHIFFEKRGSRARQQPLTEAVNAAVESFCSKYNCEPKSTTVHCQTPVGEPCLQVVDYFLWAIQRLFVRGEERFFKVIEKQVEIVWDLYDTARYPNNIYTSKNPLEAQKISPL